MSHNFFKQSQFELFPREKDDKSQIQPGNSLKLKDLTLSVENIILLSIVFVMGCVLFFSFGVERGKRLAKRSQTTEKTVEYSQVETPVVPVVEEPQAKVEIDPLDAVEEDEVREVIEVPKVEEIEIPQNLFTIQVASFKLEKNAREEAESLKKRGFEGYVLPKGSYSIVCVGKFSDRSKAKQFATKLKGRYNDYLVRRL